MNKYTIHFIQNSKSDAMKVAASDSDLAYFKFKQLNPSAAVTKIVDTATGEECSIPNTAKKEETKASTSKETHQSSPAKMELSDECIKKISNAISSSIPKSDVQPIQSKLTDLTVVDWCSIIVKANIAMLIVMAIPVGIILALNS